MVSRQMAYNTGHALQVARWATPQLVIKAGTLVSKAGQKKQGFTHQDAGSILFTWIVPPSDVPVTLTF
jgi:hypothetical protein